MSHFTYMLTPQARISAGRTGEVQNSRSIHHVLPGATIRGALGNTWWNSPTHAFRGATPAARQDAFDRLFGRALVVRDAVPDSVSQLRPASLVRQKYAGSGGTVVNGFHDLAGGPLSACPACGEAFETPRGWIALDGSGLPFDRCPACGASFEPDKQGWWVSDAIQRATTRTALELGVAADGKLFTRSALKRDLTLTGSLELREGVSVAPEAVAWLQQALTFHVGGQRSTLGRVGWAVTPTDAPEVPQGDTVILHLLSPALLVDALGFPTLDLVAALRAIPEAGSLACRPWFRTTQVSGWHGVAGVPKPTEWAIAAGATAVLRDWPDEALQRLSRGLGVRQLEGYGAVELVSPDTLETFGQRPAPIAHEDAPSDRAVDEFLAGLPHGSSRTVRAVLNAARRVNTKAGAPAADIRKVIQDCLAEAWAKQLGPDSKARVEALLGSTALAQHIISLNAAQGAQ